MRCACRCCRACWAGAAAGWCSPSSCLFLAILVLATRDPASSPWAVAVGALLVATASATQDIVIDAFRVEKS